MLDEGTLTAWEADSHHSAGCASCQRIIRDALAEIRRLQEMNRIQRIALDFDPFAENLALKETLAAHRAVIRELAELDDIPASLYYNPLVQQSREEKT